MTIDKICPATLRIRNGLCALTLASALSVIAADEGMFEFIPSYDSPANVVNMSHLLSAPAGKDGRIRIENGRFVNDKGRVRLHATNLTGPANFPTHAEAERLAARLARFGVNCVRLHYMDSAYGTFMLPFEQGILTEDFRTRRELDRDRLDRLDYLVAEFKKRGIYVNVNLHVARTLDARDGFAPGTPWANKGADQFDPRIIAEEKAYAKALLARVNPYTKMSYLDDPVVAVVELNNEDALWREYLNGAMDRLGEPYATVFRNQWNDWLIGKYGTSEKVCAAWKAGAVPLGDELIAEKTFDAPVAADGRTWILDLADAKAGLAAKDGALRVTVTRKGREYFPKIYRRVALRKGSPYTLSLRIRRLSGAGGQLGFGVADRSRGWESVGLLGRLELTAKWKTHTFTFTATKDAPAAEIQFTRWNVGEYEIDDLSLRPGGAYKDYSKYDILKGECPPIASNESAAPAARADFTQFLCDTEHKYWTGMLRYLHDELGLKAPVAATQLGYSPPHLQAELDYVDNHAYWCHPSVNRNWEIRNQAMVRVPGGCIASLAGQRVVGKPYTVSEYNHPYPIFYGAEGQPMLRAYGALQGWDGVFEYSYNNRANAEPRENEYFFSMVARTDVLAHFPACAAIYLRGDVKESESPVVANLPFEEYFPRLANGREVGQGIERASGGKLPHTLGLVRKVGVDVTGRSGPVPAVAAPKGGRYVSDTRELVWDCATADAATFTVDAPNVKLFTGFPKGRTFDLGGVALKVGETKLGWATVSLVSHDATGFDTPGRILLAATGLSHNRGAKFTFAQDGVAMSCRGDDWGKGGVVNEGVPLEVTLPVAAASVACWALDERGERKASVAVADAGGRAKVAVGPEWKTVWYELEIKR